MTVRELGPAWVRALLLHWRNDEETFVRVARLDPAYTLAKLACEQEKGWTKKVCAIWIELPPEQLIELAKNALEWADDLSRGNLFSEILTAHASRVTNLGEAKLGKNLIEACGYSKRLPSYFKSLQKMQVKGLKKWLRNQQPKRQNGKAVKEDPFAGLLIKNDAKKAPPGILKLRPKDYRSKMMERQRVYGELLNLCKESPTAKTLEAINDVLGFPRKLDDKSRDILQQLTKEVLIIATPLGQFSCVDLLVDRNFAKSEAEDKLLALAYKLLKTKSKRAVVSLRALIISLAAVKDAPKFPAESFRICYLAALRATEQILNFEELPKEVRSLTDCAANLIEIAKVSDKLGNPLSIEERKQLWSVSIRTYALSSKPQEVGIACDLYKKHPFVPDQACTVDLLAALTVAKHAELHQRQFQLILRGALANKLLNKSETLQLLQSTQTPTRVETILWTLQHLGMTHEKLFTQSLLILIKSANTCTLESFHRLLARIQQGQKPEVMNQLLLQAVTDPARKNLLSHFKEAELKELESELILQLPPLELMDHLAAQGDSKLFDEVIERCEDDHLKEDIVYLRRLVIKEQKD